MNENELEKTQDKTAEPKAGKPKQTAAEKPAKQKKAAKPGGAAILIASDSVAFDWDGQPRTIIAGRTTVRAGHPLLKTYAHLFTPLVVDFDLPVQA